MIVATRSNTISACDLILSICSGNFDDQMPDLLCLRFKTPVPPAARIAMDLTGWRYDATRNEWRVACQPNQWEQRSQEIRQFHAQWGCQFFPRYAEKAVALINLCDSHV